MIRRAGFTILEILIAIVVLVLGITGIIALFPTAIESGNKTVEDSYAAAITQSVVDAITVGVRESRYTYRSGAPSNRTYTYFVFNHDGVIEQAPLEPQRFDKNSSDDDTGDGINDKTQGAIWRRDFCVILPTALATNTKISVEPNFIFPVPSYVTDDVNEAMKDGDAEGLNQRSPGNLDKGTLIDNLAPEYQRPSSTIGDNVTWVSRVYQLGRYRQPLGSTNGGTPLPNGPDGQPMKPGDVRIEYLGDAVRSSATTPEKTIALDPYPTYSFCFALQRARIDTTGPGNVPDGKLTADQDLFSDTLYTLRVRIYKNFDRNAAHELRPSTPSDPTSAPAGPNTFSVPRTNIHIRELLTIIALCSVRPVARPI